jgi:general stress protein YciG
MGGKGSGFASMSEKRRREVQSNGGKAAHQAGVAHEWTPEEARVAGREGGRATRDNRRAIEDFLHQDE